MEIFDDTLFVSIDHEPDKPRLYGSLLRALSYRAPETGRAGRLEAGSRVQLLGHSETYRLYFYTPALEDDEGPAGMLLAEDLYDISEQKQGRVGAYRARYA